MCARAQLCTFQYGLPVPSRRPILVQGLVTTLASVVWFTFLAKCTAQEVNTAASGSRSAANKSDEWPTTSAHAPARRCQNVRQ